MKLKVGDKVVVISGADKGKEGKIINAKMTRPSNPETAKTFDALEGI